MNVLSGATSIAALTESLSAASSPGDAAAAVVTFLASWPGAGAAVVSGGQVLASAGTLEPVTEEELVGITEGTRDLVQFAGAASLRPRVVPLPRCDDEFLLVSWPAEPAAEDEGLAQAVVRILGPWMNMLRTVATERHGRELNERQARTAAQLLSSLREREELLRKNLKIQQSISHRAPLQEVLDSVTQGLTELLAADLAAVRLIDPEDSSMAVITSSSGVRREVISTVRRTPVGMGAGGQAISEGRLVVVSDYQADPHAIPAFAAERVRTAMAAPVHEGGRVVGSLVVAALDPHRSYSEAEQEALLLFAESVSLALTDAKTVEALRAAQQEREMFLAMVSHELKTPLAVIMGVLHSLRVHAQLDPATRQRLLSSAGERAGELQRLIDRLLQGARAELAGLEGEVCLSVAVERLARDFGQLRTVKIGGLPDVVIRADERAFGEILGILLENAVAHSPEGSAVEIDCAEGDHGVAVSVRNEGSLPHSTDPALLFQPWQRGAAAPSGGVGLGLYIAGRITNAIGCQLRAEDGDGTVTFTLTVPRERVRR